MKAKKGSSSKAKGSTGAGAPPTLVILMGFPGSGKSTGCATLGRLSGIASVAGDEVGTDGIKGAVSKAMKKGQSLIVDRCNVHPNDRKMWATEALAVAPDCQLVLCWFDTPVDVCKERVRTRANHPTLGPDEGDDVIDRFAKGFKPPESWELRGPKYAQMVHVVPDTAEEQLKALAATLVKQ